MSQLPGYSGVLPDIFILGVMKGGTTILHDYICTHPRVQTGKQKEIHYFSLFYDRGPAWYADHFSQVSKNCRTIDASPTYFDATNTAQIPRLIQSFAEDPRAIVIVRDPIERAISQFVHLQTIANVQELKDVDINEFFMRPLAEAYSQLTSIGYYLNQVIGFSLYTRKYLTFRQEFAGEQLLLLENKALRSNAQNEMEKVFQFLDLDYSHNDMFGKVKYSNGSGIENIEKATYQRLAEILYPDYYELCKITDLQYEEALYVAA